MNNSVFRHKRLQPIVVKVIKQINQINFFCNLAQRHGEFWIGRKWAERQEKWMHNEKREVPLPTLFQEWELCRSWDQEWIHNHKFHYVFPLVNKNKDILNSGFIFWWAKKKKKKKSTVNNPLNKNDHIKTAILNCVLQNVLDDTSLHTVASVARDFLGQAARTKH